MKTRRSQKSFEAPPPRRPRKRTIKRKSGNVVQPVVTLDSEEEGEIKEEPTVLPVQRNAEPIEVIDIDDDSIADAAPTKESTPRRNDEPSSAAVADLIPATAVAVPAVDEGPPVFEIVDEEVTADDDLNDEIEVVGVVISAKRHSRSKTRKSVKRKMSSSSGGLSQMQEAIKRAKTLVRRSSSAKGIDPHRLPLNKISANSRKIQRGLQNHFNRIGHPYAQHRMKKKPHKFKRKGLNHNRTKEFDREVILRTVHNDLVRNCDNAPNNNNFSFECLPFVPTNTSTPAPRGITHQRPQFFPSRQIHGPTPDAPPGYNIMDAAAGQTAPRPRGSLRPIVIDGSNVAVSHGRTIGRQGRVPYFSCKGIQICVDYFRKRGHTEIVVFVPRFRLKSSESSDPKLLEDLEAQGFVRFTPSREVDGMRIASYDDLFVLEYARETNGIAISNDFFRDLYDNKPHLQDTIRNRLLQYTWITENVIMFPEDPLGRTGPSLDEFLKF